MKPPPSRPVFSGMDNTVFKRILVAYDGSEGSKQALRIGLAIGQDFNAEVCAISVEGKLPRYAATLGEVDEVERERHQYFDSRPRQSSIDASVHYPWPNNSGPRVAS